MKLRNKKTGEIVETDCAFGVSIPTDKFMGCKSYDQIAEYNSLAELNEEWEDVPAEPLIKDEKIRKAVRAWAEANGLNNVAFEDYDDENIYFIDRDYETQIWFPNKSVLWSSLDDGKIYSIAELCGEEVE